MFLVVCVVFSINRQFSFLARSDLGLYSVWQKNTPRSFLPFTDHPLGIWMQYTLKLVTKFYSCNNTKRHVIVN